MKAERSEANHKSVRGFIWQAKQYSESIKQSLLNDHDLTELQAHLIAAREELYSDVSEYINPTIRNLMPDPYSIIDMEKGAKFVANAIKQKKKIAIFGDYDVDGATSSALLKKYFAHFDIDARIYIPDRIIEGYGPNVSALLQLKEEGHDLVITVDCGTTSFKPLEEAAKAGLDILVVDHHISSANIPEAVAVINPNRADDVSDLKYLAGVGVSFMLLVAVNKILREEGNSDLPNLMGLIDIVALGTVCDVVPLIGLNRALVKQGLRIMQKMDNPGIRALCEVAAMDQEEVTPFHLGFVIGPRINAGGRVGKSSLGSEILSIKDAEEIKQIALKLDHYNKERKAIEVFTQEEAMAQIELENLSGDPVIVVYGRNWHPGVIGIVAARIKDKYNKPVAVISVDDQIGKASCRSIKGVNMGELVTKAKEEGLLLEGGGHSMAAGFSIDPNKISEFKEYIRTHYQEIIARTLDNFICEYDSSTSLETLNPNLLNSLSVMEPHGMANPAPIFMFENVKVIDSRVLGSNHVKILVSEYSMGKFGKSFDAICWKSLDTEIGDFMLNSKGKTISLIGKPNLNVWNGRENVQIIIEDIIA